MDEGRMHKPISYSIRNSSEISKMRKYLIDFIIHIGDRLKQRTLTLHIAIYYIDQLLINGHLNQIKKDRHLWGVTALFLASKYDEIDRNIPYIRDFGEISSRAKYTWSEVTKCETAFLNLLNWNLYAICPMYFVSPLLSLGLIFEDDSCDKPLSSKDILSDSNKSRVQSLQKFSEFFVDIAFQSLEIQQYKYSIQAVASIVAARKTLSIDPIWNPKLETITGYQFSEIEECYQTLYSKYERYFKKSQKKNETHQNNKPKNHYLKKVNRNNANSSCEMRQPLTNNLPSKANERPVTKQAKIDLKLKEPKEAFDKNKDKNTIRGMRVLSTNTVDDIGLK